MRLSLRLGATYLAFHTIIGNSATQAETARGTCHTTGAPRYSAEVCPAPGAGLLNPIVARLQCQHAVHQLPPGGLPPRYPYDTWRMYYYDRPYNVGQTNRAPLSGIDEPADQALPYSNKVFDDVARNVESQAWDELVRSSFYEDGEKDRVDSLTKDRYIEYVDWSKHRAARVQWEQQGHKTEQLPEAPVYGDKQPRTPLASPADRLPLDPDKTSRRETPTTARPKN